MPILKILVVTTAIIFKERWDLRSLGSGFLANFLKIKKISLLVLFKHFLFIQSLKCVCGYYFLSDSKKYGIPSWSS